MAEGSVIDVVDTHGGLGASALQAGHRRLDRSQLSVVLQRNVSRGVMRQRALS